MTDEKPPSFTAWAVRAAALWIAAGALFKLYLGSPQDLPELFREHFPGTPLLQYRVAIAIELAVAWLAILRPRLGWGPVVLLLVVFDAILSVLVAQGAESCGCFGKEVPISPTAMMGIDSVLLLAILLGRPWRGLVSTGVHPGVVLLAVLASLVVPWTVDRTAKAPPSAEDAGDGLRSFLILTPKEWVGDLIYDIAPLQGWIDFAPLPLDGTYIFYRSTCDHCATHLETLAAEDDGTRAYVLIRLVGDEDNEANQVVHVLPDGPHVTRIELPRGVTYGITTPADFDVEGGIVVRGREGIPVD